MVKWSGWGAAAMRYGALRGARKWEVGDAMAGGQCIPSVAGRQGPVNTPLYWQWALPHQPNASDNNNENTCNVKLIGCDKDIAETLSPRASW